MYVTIGSTNYCINHPSPDPRVGTPSRPMDLGKGIKSQSAYLLGILSTLAMLEYLFDCACGKVYNVIIGIENQNVIVQLEAISLGKKTTETNHISWPKMTIRKMRNKGY